MGVKGDDCFMGCRRPFPIGAWVNVWRNCISRPAAQAITNVCNSKKAGGGRQNFKFAALARPASPPRAYFFPPDRIVKRNGKMTEKPSARLILKIRASDRATMAAAPHFYLES